MRRFNGLTGALASDAQKLGRDEGKHTHNVFTSDGLEHFCLVVCKGIGRNGSTDGEHESDLFGGFRQRNDSPRPRSHRRGLESRAKHATHLWCHHFLMAPETLCDFIIFIYFCHDCHTTKQVMSNMPKICHVSFLATFLGVEGSLIKIMALLQTLNKNVTQ